MRVISGKYRSRKLQEVDNIETRETKDRVKESIFNSVSNDLIDSTVLDLFAGSGSLGIEALSRGAIEATFVDMSSDAMKALRANVDALHIQSNCSIYHKDYESFLEDTYQKFDIILLDPPYKMDVIDDIIKLIARKKILSETGVIICLYSKTNTLLEQNNGIIEYKKKTIGITNVSFMRWGI